MSTNEEQLIRWDIGTAYDFFASLVVLHNPEMYGLPGSWAAGVRSRLPAAARSDQPSSTTHLARRRRPAGVRGALRWDMRTSW